MQYLLEINFLDLCTTNPVLPPSPFVDDGSCCNKIYMDQYLLFSFHLHDVKLLSTLSSDFSLLTFILIIFHFLHKAKPKVPLLCCVCSLFHSNCQFFLPGIPQFVCHSFLNFVLNQDLFVILVIFRMLTCQL